MLRLLSILLLLIPADMSASGATVGTRLHVERSFTIMLSAPPVVALQAFGPLAEKGWVPGFNPVFAYPNPPKAINGAVFTLRRHSTQVWLLQTWDVRHYIVQYVAVDPGAKATDIRIRLVPWGVHRSRATISYTWTSLTSAGDANVTHLAKYFVSEAPHWESSINDYLAGHASL
jgi:hypothetical protein